MPRLRIRPTLLAVLAGLAGTTCGAALAQAVAPPGRGELLYATHCIECHSTQLHWREQRQARDWDSLKAQVRRWQGTAGLGWSDEDIVAVARHLHDRVSQAR
jgi:mono/diheme cytochrome c family protein